LLLESEQPHFFGLPSLLVFALGNRPSRMLLIQTHDALEQALLTGAERLPLCKRKWSRHILYAAVMPSLIERGHHPQAHKADHESIGCYPEERSGTRATE